MMHVGRHIMMHVHCQKACRCKGQKSHGDASMPHLLVLVALVGHEHHEAAIDAEDGAEVVVPEEDRQLPLPKALPKQISSDWNPSLCTLQKDGRHALSEEQPSRGERPPNFSDEQLSPCLPSETSRPG